MPRRRELLVVGTCAVWLLAFSTILQAQPALDVKPPSVEEPSPLLLEPQTPEESFAAALLMVDLARLDLAKKYLDQFNAGATDDALLIAMRDKHGTAAFAKLVRIPELKPVAEPLLERLNAASRKQSEDPAFVDALIARLSQGPTQREIAISELRNAGPRAVPQMIRQMSRPDMVEKQDDIALALIRMGRQVVPPLLGALDSPEDRIRAAVINILATLQAREAVPHLWFPAFSESQPMGVRMAASRALSKLLAAPSERESMERVTSIAAASELRRFARMLYENADLLPRDENEKVPIWGWDGKEQTVAAHVYSPQIAGLLMSARFAKQALELYPEEAETQRQYLASLLALEVLQQGWEKPREPLPGTAMYLAMTAGEETVANVLTDALASNQPATAVAALEVLGQVGTREQLLNKPGLKSPVLAALNSPDQRVQFAAAVTTLRLEPRTGFTGAARVVSVLARALTDSGKANAVIIDADTSRGSQAAGYLFDLGYEPIAVTTGREGFERAAATAGVQVVLVHANCIRWDLTQTLANLRADSRTAAIPIVIYGPESLRGSLGRQLLRNKPAIFMSETTTASDFGRQFTPLMRNTGAAALSSSERSGQKATAAYWLATIATMRGAPVFEVSTAEGELSLVAEDPQVAANALVALSGIGTGSSQRRLAQLATNTQSDSQLRQVAAAQLSFHIQRFGILLTKDEIAGVHSAWADAKDPEVKASLGGVMGTLRPNTALVGERLREFTAPTLSTPD